MKKSNQNINASGPLLEKKAGVSTGHSPFNLLMLSGGSLVGQNVLSALAMRRDSCRLFALDSKYDEPAIFDYDTVFLAPSLVEAREDFERRFEEVLSLVNPDLIIPCRDDDVFFVSALAEKRPDLRSRLLCGSAEIAAAMLDKWLSYKFSEAHDLPFVATICADVDNLETKILG